MKVKINLFGTFRKYEEYGDIFLELNKEVKLAEIRNLFEQKITELAQNFSDTEILKISAFAKNEEMMTEDEELGEVSELAILPPVCGG